jgi:DNA-binding PadR family transcriptional regulator
VSNITRARDGLKARQPQLVIQVQKSGKSKQARKRYKVTSAGKTEVRRMLSGKWHIVIGAPG